MKTSFFDYEIVKYLQEKNSVYYGKIQELYPICEDILSEIPKQFSNYTLHDIGHSVRVIGYMNDLVKAHLNDFSELQLALIVYVGLLHDIGMFVSEEEKDALYKKFERLNCKFGKMAVDEKDAYLKEYIRKNHGKRVADALNYEINGSTKIKSLLYAGYSLSYDLTELISQICQSHTEGCEWITQNLPLNCMYAKDVINPQQIALLLRIGDALDIDDRRAPYILYKLLNPKGVSDKEWKKHIPITNYNKIENVENFYEITFSGGCKEPEIYRKLMEYIDGIDNDLKNIEIISNSFQSHYRLNIKVPVNRKIIPQGFSDTLLRFRLDYNQVVNLLMGEKIYGNKREGLRELLQNAIDAVMVMRNIYENTVEYGVKSYVPEIRILVNKSKNIFQISDNGTGMSEEILDKYFFNVGNSYYTSENFNECNYEYQPIGHFGIGFLACFMLSHKIELETKYYENSDNIQMLFDKDSPYVTKLNNQKEKAYLEHGTSITLEYDKIVPHIFRDDEDIISYINELLIVEDFELCFVNQETKETVKIRDTRLKNRFETEDERIDFAYELDFSGSIVFNVFEFFDNNEDVFIIKYNHKYNEMDIENLAFYAESITALEVAIQSGEKELEGILNGTEDILDLPVSDFLLTELWENEFEAHKKGIDQDHIRDYFVSYIYEYIINNNVFEWYDIPLILNQNIFNNFIACADKDGIDAAISQYSNSIRFVSLLTKEKVTDEMVLDVVEKYLEFYREGDNFIDVSYYDKYPVSILKKRISLLGIEGTNSYLSLVKNNKKIDASYYLKGIRINDETIAPDFTIKGIDLKNICLNIKKGTYDTDVSRNKFDLQSKKKLLKKLLYIIYTDIIKTDKLEDLEVELVKLFLSEVCDDGTGV